MIFIFLTCVPQCCWPTGWERQDALSASSRVETWLNVSRRFCSATDTKTVPTALTSEAVVSPCIQILKTLHVSPQSCLERHAFLMYKSWQHWRLWGETRFCAFWGFFPFFFGELLHIWKMCGAAHSSVHAHTNTHEQICTYACTHTHTLIYLLTGGARQLVLFFLEWSEEKIWQWINVFCLRNNAGFYSSWRLFVCLLAKSKSCFIWMQLWVFPFMCYNLLLGP